MSTKEFTRKVFRWLAQIKNDHECTHSAALVALQLIEHFNEGKGGAAWASCKSMAHATGCAESTVNVIVHGLEARGHLRVEWGKQGRGHSNHYWMIVKPRPADVSEPPKHRPTDVKKHRSAELKHRSTEIKHRPTDENHLMNQNGAPKAPLMERERRSLALTDPPGALAPNGGAPDEKKGEVATLDRWFAELRAVWARPWLDDEAADRAAFFRATAEVDPANILAGAQVWTAAVEPRFRKPLKKWLDARGWEKPPPKPRQRKGAKPALAAMFIKAGQS